MTRSDWRLLDNGSRIPAENYADQPYVVRTGDGAWLCCVTTGSGNEGAQGQHVCTCRSTDLGRSWSEPIFVEEPGDVENSYAVMLKAPSGRVFIFYNRNTDNVREVEKHDRSGTFTRVDCLGSFVFKYSDDCGRSWSRERYEIPFRLFDCDRNNVYGGRIRFFWNVGRAFAFDGAAWVSLIRVGEMGEGFYQRSEGSLLKSPDLFDVENPGEAHWITLPDGGTGLRTPPGGGPIAEEQCFVPLDDGSLYVTCRTIDGYPVEAYSRDGGRSWPELRYMRRASGRAVKHPRAANFVWKCSEGRYLYWFHNHGGPFIRRRPQAAYEDRNPSWLLAGIEMDSPEGRVIRWGEPELLLYHDDPMVRFSYPDLIEQQGRYFVTETEKNLARVHEIPADFLETMWARVRGESVTPDAGILFEAPGGSRCGAPPELPEFYRRDYTQPNHGGMLTSDGCAFEVELAGTVPGSLLEGRDDDGRGIALELDPELRIILTLDNGNEECRMRSERISELASGDILTVNVDGGPGIVSFVRNGVFLDGGEELQFGWRRFNPRLIRRFSPAPWQVGQQVRQLRVFDRALMTAECRCREYPAAQL
ncbi:sialidase family protein [Victivallis vadensis]|uniref:sialidase family protein n=1 Tax=Victivallis vadensis TaxID=172901 RepID=UPI003AF53ACA